MLSKLLRFTVIGASVLALAACGQGTTGTGTSDGSVNGFGNKYGTNSANTSYRMMHNNTNLRVDRNASRAVERINGVTRANVVVGDTNAYVAVELDRNGGFGDGMRRGTAGIDTIDGTGNGVNNRGMTNRTGLNGSGTKYGTFTGNTGLDANNGLSGRMNSNNGLRGNGLRGGMNGNNGLGANDGLSTGLSNGYYGQDGRLGQRYTGMVGTDNLQGTGRGGNNLYNQTGMNPQLVARIQNTVKQVAPNVRNVYVSADRTFVDRMGTFGDRLNGGGPVENLVADFNNFLNGMFDNDRYDTNWNNATDRYNARNRGVFDLNRAPTGGTNTVR